MSTTATEPTSLADRTRARIFEIMNALANSPDGTGQWSDLRELARDALPPTAEELSPTARPNRVQWEHNLTDMMTRFMVGAGFVRRSGGISTLTDAGREAMRDASGSQELLWDAARAARRTSLVDPEIGPDGTEGSVTYPKNLILYGPPGTGKTYATTEEALRRVLGAAESLPDLRSEMRTLYREKVAAGQIAFVTFHQAFSYEDFVEGIQAEVVADGPAAGTIRYDVKGGVFRNLAEEADAHQDRNYVLVIDEINRGNVAGIFGELITLIEEDKRLGLDEELRVTLPYSRRSFGVPPNLYLIGTMNTADRLLAGLDLALRRRFDFQELAPDAGLLDEVTIEGLSVGAVLRKLNERIQSLKGRDFAIGHALFIPLHEDQTLSALARVFSRKVLPLLQEYFFEDWSQIAEVLNQRGAPNESRYLRSTASRVPGGADLWTQNESVLTSLDFYRRILQDASTPAGGDSSDPEREDPDATAS